MFLLGTSAMAASNAGAAAVGAGSPAVSSSGSRLSNAQRTSPKFIRLKTDFYYRRLLYHRCVIQAFLCTGNVSICPQASQLRLTGPVRRGTEDRGLRSSQGLRLLPYLLAEGAAAARKQRGRIPKEAGGCRRLACEAPLTVSGGRIAAMSAWQEGE